MPFGHWLPALPPGPLPASPLLPLDLSTATPQPLPVATISTSRATCALMAAATLSRAMTARILTEIERRTFTGHSSGRARDCLRSRDFLAGRASDEKLSPH